jgi:methylated-DNA-protein-cysteine methyltransferase-like protein
MTTFGTRVYEVTAHIPKGKVATYGQIARLAGSARAARAVGGLMARNTHSDIVPCHRVVGSDGRLTGYAFRGVGAKRRKLLAEGVAFTGARVDLAASLWRH